MTCVVATVPLKPPMKTPNSRVVHIVFLPKQLYFKIQSNCSTAYSFPMAYKSIFNVLPSHLIENFLSEVNESTNKNR